MNNSKMIAALLTICAVLFSVLYAVAEETAHVGTVKEIKEVSNYVYLKIDEDGKDVWLAAQPMEVSEGDQVEYIGGVPMVQFYSMELDKTFDSILLITRIRNLSKPGEESGQEASKGDYHGQKPQEKGAVSFPEKGEIAKAENGKTVQEIFAGSEQLKDKEVVLRAKVMKISRNVLGKNWITLSDGTGAAPDNKILALTSGDADAGDILTVRGIVKTDVNIGSGYNYKVLIGDAKFEE